MQQPPPLMDPALGCRLCWGREGSNGRLALWPCRDLPGGDERGWTLREIFQEAVRGVGVGGWNVREASLEEANGPGASGRPLHPQRPAQLPGSSVGMLCCQGVGLVSHWAVCWIRPGLTLDSVSLKAARRPAFCPCLSVYSDSRVSDSARFPVRPAR